MHGATMEKNKTYKLMTASVHLMSHLSGIGLKMLSHRKGRHHCIAQFPCTNNDL